MESGAGTGKSGRFDKERTRQAILDAACAEFAERGLSGGRVEAIAARTSTVKRMIYYYFGSKKGLYLAALERAYDDIRTAEKGLDLLRFPPAEAIRRLVEFTFDYQEANPAFIRLVAIENIHNAAHIEQSATIRQLNLGVIELLDEILRRGRKEGLFRANIDAVDVHMLISAFCFFRVSNRYTFGVLFDRDLSAPSLRKRHKAMIVEAVLRSLDAQTSCKKTRGRQTHED